MTDNYEIMPPQDEIIPVNPPIKWLRYLFYIHIASIVLSFPTLFFLENPITPWISHGLEAGIILCLFRLMPVCPRYRKAAILTAVYIGLSVISSLWVSSLLTIAISVLTIIASYQEYHGHAEIVARKDEKLAQRWKSLFVWQIVIGVISGFSSVAAVTIMVLADMDLARITTLVAGAILLVGLIPGILYLVYLRRMISLFDE